MSVGGTPSLSDQLCFDLYAASRSVTQAYRPVLGELGVTYPQYLVLLVLWERGTSTVKEVAGELRLDHGTLTPLLQRMQGAGLVTRQRAQDERFVEVALTAEGEAMRAHATRIHCDMKDLLGLDDTEFSALQTTLRLLASRADRGVPAVADPDPAAGASHQE